LEIALAKTSRHVVRAEIICGHQIELIERMSRQGLDTAVAEDLLKLFFQILDTHYVRLRILIRNQS
jgi:predicted unusual protein kinase regulating ubiquinone biosynthesis (AarF/ABC1/UbiB family)